MTFGLNIFRPIDCTGHARRRTPRRVKTCGICSRTFDDSKERANDADTHPAGHPTIGLSLRCLTASDGSVYQCGLEPHEPFSSEKDLIKVKQGQCDARAW